MRKLALLSAVVWLTLSGAAHGIEAPLVADAHVNSARPDTNSGAISNLNVGAGYTSLIQFDLGVLPSGTTSSQVSRALLRLYCNRADITGLVRIQPVTSAWGEYSVTYSSLPTLDAPVQVVGVTGSGTFVWIDVTAQVQRWITAPASNNGLAITAGSASVQFDSKENDLTGHAPALDISLVSQGPKGDTGAAGPAGPQGPAGVAGAIGPAGPVGATGPQGPQELQGVQGAQGVQGLPGLKGDTGSTGPAGPAGAIGPIGPPGPAGATGPVGPAGLSGATGPSGPQGVQGPQGPAGSPGLVYRGTYDSTANYNLGDVVLWQGSSYASLASSNYGNTPSSNPAYWGVLSAQGPAGVQGIQGSKGDTGAQGPIGATGPAGERGPQGEQGIAGQAGAQGIPGAQGPQGLQGPMGPQGPAGPAGMTFRGVYSSTTNYALGDGVTYGVSGYVSLVDANHGNTPDQSPSVWAVFATGVQGQAGAAGAPGAQGPAVANYTGNYVSTTNYARNDAVSYDGSTYISLVAGNVGQTPSSSPTYWAVLAAQGPAGPAGAAGPQGAAGPVGPAGAPGAMGPQGPPVSFRGDWLIASNYALGDAVSYGGGSYIALVANSGRRPDVSPVYWGVLAQPGIAGAAGATGAQGPQGQQGPAGISYKGAWSAQTGYVANDAVFYNGSTYLALATSLTAPPDTTPSAWAMLAQAGVMGATGPAGAAATVAIGTVTTGAAGTQAAVTNSGSPSAAVLNFVIPQGAAGTSGPTGGAGGETSGIPFMSVYHSVSFYTIFYSVNNSNSSADESESILTWIPSGCTATKLSVFSRQSNTITVTLRSGILGAIANTALSCSVSPNSSCTSTGTAVVPADGFLDFAISGASGTPAGVWTAVLCN